MKRNKWIKSLAMGLISLGVAVAVGCGQGADKAAEKPQTLDDKVDAIVANMSYKEKLGQMVMIGIHGTELTDDAKYMLSQYHIGNIILFDRNLQTAEQTVKLTADLQQAASDAGQPVPLFIGIDEEGGPVSRGKGFIEPPPSQRVLGAAQDTVAAESWARKTGEQLRKLGINVNFAPVADLGAASERSYGADPEQATKMLKAATQGYEESHVIYALKHFPGIGRGTVDSHQDVSAIDISREELRNTDLKPFQAIIDRDTDDDFFVLVSHLKYPQLDAKNSASQSRAIITDLLRGEMGYQGLIITDDLEMGAVAKHGSFRQLGVNAVKAGADMVMICHEYEHETEIYLGMLEAYENGELDKGQIDASVKRIVKAKLLHQ